MIWEKRDISKKIFKALLKWCCEYKQKKCRIVRTLTKDKKATNRPSLSKHYKEINVSLAKKYMKSNFSTVIFKSVKDGPCVQHFFFWKWHCCCEKNGKDSFKVENLIYPTVFLCFLYLIVLMKINRRPLLCVCNMVFALSP